ncbi:MAG: L,D-transpeptidase [Rhizobiaceae bacterium]
MTKKPKSGSAITVRRRPGHPDQGILRFGTLAMRCAIGRSGISALKREGDGATPRAAMEICWGYVRKRRAQPFRSRLLLALIRPEDGWCDAPSDRNYNRPVRLPYSASAEMMLRKDELYDVCIVLDWNLSSRRRQRGSAIFLHIAKPGYPATEGCVAISKRDMQRLLPYLRPGTRLKTVSG